MPKAPKRRSTATRPGPLKAKKDSGNASKKKTSAGKVQVKKMNSPATAEDEKPKVIVANKPPGRRAEKVVNIGLTFFLPGDDLFAGKLSPSHQAE